MKRIISVLLCAVLAAGVFSACSKKAEARELKLVYDAAFSDVSDEVKNAYSLLFTAVLNGEESAEISSDILDDVTTVFYTGFPLSELVDSIKANSNGTSVRIKYTNSSDEHKKLVDKFTLAASEILDECEADSSNQNELILKLYSYIAQNVEIDYKYSTAYDAIVNKKGSSSAFEAAFNFLLQQEGIPALRMYAQGYDGTHFLTQAQINGEEYYFDPCGESSFSDGSGLSYFGMSFLTLQRNGITCELTCADQTVLIPEQNSDAFGELFQTVSYEYKGGVITAKRISGKTVEVKL